MLKKKKKKIQTCNGFELLHKLQILPPLALSTNLPFGTGNLRLTHLNLLKANFRDHYVMWINKSSRHCQCGFR